MALTHRSSDFALDSPPGDFLPREIELRTVDGVWINAGWVPSRSMEESSATFVLAHGFTGSWREPRVQAVMAHLVRFGNVLAIDQRGHGRSTGLCTVGMDEVLDVDAAVEHLRRTSRGEAVVTVGFSMGGSVTLRHAALAPGSVHTPEHRPDAVVSVSAPGFWFYRGTKVMRFVHRLIENPLGRALLKRRGVRLTSKPWPEPPPWSPADSVRKMGDFPLLMVHGDIDHYFPVEHVRVLEAAAESVGNSQATVIVVPGFAHAESTVDPATMDCVGKWALEHARIS